MADDEFASEKSETIENLLKLDELWHDRMPVPATARRSYSAEDDERRQFFFDSLGLIIGCFKPPKGVDFNQLLKIRHVYVY